MANIVTMHAAQVMRPYAIELPRHILRFSIPEEIAHNLSPREVEVRFDPCDSSFAKNGFREIAGTMHDFNGPFWVGAYGSLKFHFMVQKKRAEFAGDISTADGLEFYVRQWNGTIEGRATGCTFSRVLMNGMPAVRREWNTFGDSSTIEPDNLEILSLPLSDEMFLDIGFNIKEWESGRGKEREWKPKAEALREAIKATVILEPK
ncbi:hypothetical protein [Nibricoccus sp. IMCC34717]|uniref:hypothetical protein n=1 Tax=Nibricoccus sp. IMCC34717 TaxID=3034021 RepID=UPI003850573C